MVGHFPDWNARRIRTPIPAALPGYMLTPYVPKTLLYVLSTQFTAYCIDLDGGQVVSEGSPLNVAVSTAIQIDQATLLSSCPADGTIAGGWIGASRSYGLLGRHGDTAILFPVTNSGAPGEVICDSSNGPSEIVGYTTTCAISSGQTHWYFCRKNDSVVVTIATSFAGFASAAGIDCDRAGNWFLFASAGTPPNTRNTLFRQGASGSGFVWTVNPDHTGGTIPAYPIAQARTGLDKLIVVGPPELDGGVWHQSVFSAIPSGWLVKHDCRSGAYIVGGTTTLRPQNLNATPDGLIIKSSGVITKLNLDTLATVWTHSPSAFSGSTLTPGPMSVDCCGDLIYSTNPDAQGAVHIRKIKGSDGTPMLDQAFFLPIAGMPIVTDCGRIGGYSWPNEPWVQAGSPAISF
jgi:hypothetical protein